VERGLPATKKRVRQTVDQLAFHPDFKSVKVVVDVDPY
jgi:hypothetical protein